MGPYADDYFLCFATGLDDWYEASFYANNRDAFLDALETKLGTPLRLGLCHSTDFASRVLWPPEFAGTPLFEYQQIPVKGWLGRTLGSSQVKQTFSEPIRKYLANRPE